MLLLTQSMLEAFIKVKSASGPDGISTQMLKIYSSSISQYLLLLFNESLSSKTKLMILSRRLHPTQRQITVANSAITQLTFIKYLGMTVTSNLSRCAYIDNTC